MNKLLLTIFILALAGLTLAVIAYQDVRTLSFSTIYVSKGGNDANNGSQRLPFLSVTRAMASITETTQPYVISIGPGIYEEPLIHLKGNVQLVGAATALTRLQIPFDLDNWISDARSGFTNLTLLSEPLDFNFRTTQNQSGRLFLVSVGVDPTLTVTSLSNTQNTGNQI